MSQRGAVDAKVQKTLLSQTTSVMDRYSDLKRRRWEDRTEDAAGIGRSNNNNKKRRPAVAA